MYYIIFGVGFSFQGWWICVSVNSLEKIRLNKNLHRKVGRYNCYLFISVNYQKPKVILKVQFKNVRKQVYLMNFVIYYHFQLSYSLLTFGLWGYSFYVPHGYYINLFSYNFFFCTVLFVSAREHSCTYCKNRLQ